MFNDKRGGTVGEEAANERCRQVRIAWMVYKVRCELETARLEFPVVHYNLNYKRKNTTVIEYAPPKCQLHRITQPQKAPAIDPYVFTPLLASIHVVPIKS
jgi:hypothetical protein